MPLAGKIYLDAPEEQTFNINVLCFAWIAEKPGRETNPVYYFDYTLPK